MKHDLFRFGPISRVFRDAAENPPASTLTVDAAVQSAGFYWIDITTPDDAWDAYYDADDLTRSLWLLLMAESLADIGV